MHTTALIQWKSAHPWEQELLHAMEALFTKHPQLLQFTFDEKEPLLRLAPEKLIENSCHFPLCERLLLRIALDIWNGSGSANLCGLIDFLDYSNFLACWPPLLRSDPGDPCRIIRIASLCDVLIRHGGIP